MNVTQAKSTNPTPPQQSVAPKQETAIMLVRSTEKAQAAQKEISAEFSGLDRSSVLTKAGMKFALGTPSMKAKVKDSLVHTMHKMSDRLAPGSVGSHHKEAVRLADAYNTARESGASLQEQQTILQNLKHELEAHKPSGEAGNSVGKLVEFVDHELTILENQFKAIDQDKTALIETWGSKMDVAMHRLKEHTGVATNQLNKEIEGFDRTKMKHVDRQEDPTKSTVPKWAKHEFDYASRKSDIVSSTPQGQVQEQRGMLLDPGLSALSSKFRGSAAYRNQLTYADKALKGGNDQTIKDTAQKMGKRFAKDINAQGHLTQTAFAISDGAKFKDLLYSQLCASNPQLPESYADAPAQVKSFMDEMFQTILDELPNKQTAKDKILFNGKEFTKGKLLGSGAFGSVHLYEHTREVTDPSTGKKSTVTEQLAIKTFIPSFKEDAANEIRSHQSAMGSQGHENVVGMKGVIRCPDGSLMMAMEVASTDATTTMQRLDEAVADGTISKEAAYAIRLTMFKDMLQGLQHFQETRGMTHGDIKDPNYLIGPDGRAKLADFGTAVNGTSFWYGKNVVDNPTWKAPEVMIQDATRKTAQDAITDDITEQRKVETERIKSQVPKKDQAEAHSQAKKGFDAQKRDRLADLPPNVATNKADTWALGITAYTMFFGEAPFSSTFFSEIEDLVVAYGKNPDSSLVEMGKDASGNSTGKPVTAMDRIFHGMLHVDPSKRSSISDVLRNPVFQEPYVGSGEVYDLIKELSSENPDPDKLKEKSNELGR